MKEERALLFFDDQCLERRENLNRNLGQPSSIPDGNYRDSELDPSWGYPSVFFDLESRRWRCLYQAQLPSKYVRKGEKLQHIALVLESEDGINWLPPDLTDLIPLKDRIQQHQVLPLADFLEWGPCFYDAVTEDPSERLKAFVSMRDETGTYAPLYVSANGLSWRRLEDRQWHPSGIDPAVSGFWNPIRNSYVIAARPSWGDRRIAVYETQDWRSFSKPEVAMRPDGEDTPAAQVYGMPVFQYAQMFIGLLWIYHTDPSTKGGKFVHGKVDCQLAYSYNGWHFNRFNHSPFLPKIAPGNPGYGAIYPSSMVLSDCETIRIYSSSSEGEHAQITSDPLCGQGCLLLHELRKDGFVYLEPSGGPGSLTTRPLFFNGGQLVINAQVPHGRLRLQITDGNCNPLPSYGYDDCQPFVGNSVSWKPTWREGRTATALTGQVIRLEVEIFNGRLYSIRGDLRPVTSGSYRQWMKTGAIPESIIDA